MNEDNEVQRVEPEIVGPVAPVSDDFLLQVAAQAEQRIDAVVKIKRIAIKVTNGMDWCDQNGRPYMMVSAAEKIANLFNISWRIEEPRLEEESDGHYTYTYRGTFTLAGRTIDAEGSRSSRDGFFRQYNYPKDSDGKSLPKEDRPVGDRDNRRDVRMSAYTNLLGNGISRILGMRNLTYADLEEFAGITQAMIGKVEYKKRPPVQQPQPLNKTGGKPAQNAQGGTQEAPHSTGSAGTGDGKGEQAHGETGAPAKAVFNKDIPMPDGAFLRNVVLNVVKVDEKGKSPRYYVKAEDGNWYSTFDEKAGKALLALSERPASLVYKLEQTPKGEFRTVLSVGEISEAELSF